MKPKNLYHTLGMDKKVYSDAPVVKREPVEQGEHFYVSVHGKNHIKLMINFLKSKQGAFGHGVINSLIKENVTILRMNIVNSSDRGVKYCATKSSMPIVRANNAETINVYDFMQMIEEE